MKKYDEFAFPTSEANDHHGLTLRDYFAAKAMQSLIGKLGHPETIVSRAYEYADAMLEARQK